VRLEPLGPQHAEALYEAARPEEIWTWISTPPALTRAAWEEWFAAALAESEAGREAAFATVDRTTGTPIGSTRFLALRPGDRGLEIGHTWLTPAAWGSGANVEAKLLQMAHAFEALRCIRVELKTHARNARSRGAMERMGAQFEGIFRKHRVIPGIGIRDSAWYSVTDDDWPAVKAGLQERLAGLAR
jgi:N-acetyltransferase